MARQPICYSFEIVLSSLERIEERRSRCSHGPVGGPLSVSSKSDSGLATGRPLQQQDSFPVLFMDR
jgi:hypothetical protein